MINVVIDEFTPCLKDARTVELVQTEVIRIKRNSGSILPLFFV